MEMRGADIKCTAAEQSSPVRQGRNVEPSDQKALGSAEGWWKDKDTASISFVTKS